MADVSFFAYCDIEHESHWKEQLIKDNGPLHFVTIYYLFGGENHPTEIPFGNSDKFIPLQIPKMFLNIDNTSKKINFKQKDDKDLILDVKKVTLKPFAKISIAFLSKDANNNTICDISKSFDQSIVNEETLKAMLGGATSGFKINSDTTSAPICL